jgi:glycosyl hydrolase family 59 (putative galactocerebrosidase)
MTSSGKRRRRLGGPLVILAVLLAVFTGAGSASAATLAADDFEDGNAAGWTTTGGTWIVNWDGSSRVLRQSSLAANALARVGSVSWRNYTVTADVKPESFNGMPGFAGVVARAQSTSDYYALVLRPNDTAALTRTVGGTTQTLATLKTSIEAGTWYTLSLGVDGRKLTGSVNGASITATDGFLYGGPAGFVTTWTTASFDEVVVAD